MGRYDVIVVGAGPAGIFAALELLDKRPRLKLLIIEKGKDIDKRRCPMKYREISCTACAECALLSGWGGAGAFSDGKLTLSPDIGGFMLRYMDRDELEALIGEADATYRRFGAPKKIYGGAARKVKELQMRAREHGLTLIPSKIRHIGTDRCPRVLKKMKTWLEPRADIEFGTDVESILVKNGNVSGVRLSDGTEHLAGCVVLAPGREGAKWLEAEVRRLKLTTLKNPVDIGVRVELPAEVMEPMTSVTYEPKLVYESKTFNDRVRTFCVNPYGEVVKEYLMDIWTVNGHSYARSRTEYTNFALLVSTTFTRPFNEPISYGRYIARLANFLGQGVLVQRLGDLRRGRRSTPARIKAGKVNPTLKDSTPGDLSFVLPYRYLSDIMEMLEAMDAVAPGVNSPHTLLYGIEVKFYSMQLKLTDRLETRIKGLFAVGDGPGVSRGLIQASASGIVAAREILRRKR